MTQELMMTKQELIQATAQQAGTTQTQVQQVMDAMIGQIHQALHDEEAVYIRDLGKWDVKDIPARTARNPQTGETFSAQPTKRVIFKSSEPLKRSVKTQT